MSTFLLITYSSASCPIAIGTSWGKEPNWNIYQLSNKFKAVMICNGGNIAGIRDKLRMEEKEAIVFDDAFIRKAFKGDLCLKIFSQLIESGYDMDGDGEISTREFKIVMKR